MSEKMACPGCGSYSSSVLSAYNAGAECPSCGLGADTALVAFQALQRGDSKDLVKRYTDASIRADEAQRRVFKLEKVLRAMQEAIDGVRPYTTE